MGKLDILAKTLQQKSVLESIQIRNFKAIQDTGLKLDKLTNVNYLVGENGSGKSSVLEAIHLLWIIGNYNRLGGKAFEYVQLLENTYGYTTEQSILKIRDYSKNTSLIRMGPFTRDRYSELNPFTDLFVKNYSVVYSSGG